MTTTIQNSRPRPGEMEDDQRKAMFARGFGGGGGRGGGWGGGSSKKATASSSGSSATQQPTKPFDPSGQTKNKYVAMAQGFGEGALDGLQNVFNAFTAGMSDKMGWTDTSKNTGPEVTVFGTKYDVSKTMAGLSAGIVHGLMGAKAGTTLLKYGGQFISPAFEAAAAAFPKAAGLASKFSAPITAASAWSIANEIADYRDDNPGMNPYAEKALAMAETIAGYVGTMGALGSAKQVLGALGRAISINGISAASMTKASLAALDRAIATAGSKIKSVTPSAVQKVAGKTYDAYSKAADFTGSTLRDLKTAPGAYKALEKAAADKSFGQWLGGPQGAAIVKQADKAAAEAGKAIAKAGYVSGGLTAKLGNEEIAATKYEMKARKDLAAGRTLTSPIDEERSLLGTVAAAGVGTFGNSLEKQFRFGQDTYNADTGAYRAMHKQITDAQARGEITKSQADRALIELGESRAKPYDMAGKSLWTMAPAFVAFGDWKIGEMLAEGRRSTTGKVTKTHDADTIWIEGGNPDGARFMGINAPETADKPGRAGQTSEIEKELGAKAYAEFLDMVDVGQFVRVTKDSNQKTKFAEQSLDTEIKKAIKAGTLDPDTPIGKGLEKYDRDIGTVLTLPKPFDKILGTPLGRFVPNVLMTDVGTEMVRSGNADIAFRSAAMNSWNTDTQLALDKAHEEAKAKGTGIWTPEAKAAMKWVGDTKTIAERNADLAAKGKAPEETYGNLTKLMGSGIMVTGNSGAVQMMPQSGTATMQLLNAAVAVAGVLDYNERARNAKKKNPIKKKGAKKVIPKFQKELDKILRPPAPAITTDPRYL